MQRLFVGDAGVAIFARGNAVAFAEDTRKMRGVVKASGIGQLRDGAMTPHGVRKTLLAFFKTPAADKA